MSLYTDIRDGLETMLDGVANIGQVEPQEHYLSTWEGWQDKFKATIGGKVQIRGWIIRRESVANEALPGPRMGAVGQTHFFVVEGFMTMRDADDTWSEFNSLVDAVMDALEAEKDFGNTSVVDYATNETSCRVIDLQMMGDVLCHHCEIVVPVVSHHSVTQT